MQALPNRRQIQFPLAATALLAAPFLTGGCAAGGRSAFDPSVSPQSPSRGDTSIRVAAPPTHLAKLASQATPSPLLQRSTAAAHKTNAQE